MTATDYVIWFIATACLFVALMTIGVAGSSGYFRHAEHEERKQRRRARREEKALAPGWFRAHGLTIGHR